MNNQVIGSRLHVIVSIFIIVFSITYHLFPTPSFAHFVKSEGSIGTLLHMDPEDDPVAGAESKIILEFKDTEGKFRLAGCDCNLQILENGKELNLVPLSEVSENEKLTSITPFTFPEKNVYKLKITGKAKSAGQFTDFELDYDVRVAREVEKSNSQQSESWVSGHLIHLIGGVILIIALVIGLFIKNKRKVAVIILIGILLSHFVPIKAIHASHSADFDSHSYTCCLPVNGPVSSQPVLEAQSSIPAKYYSPAEFINYIEYWSYFYTRAPPIS